MKVLSFDISGNFKEGKGTTGIAHLSDGKPTFLDELKASDYNSAEEYWAAHEDYIMREWPDQMIIEGYRLYHHKGMNANSQANSELETPQLKGIIRLVCYRLKIPLTIQYASEVKQRWKEPVLVRLGYLTEKGSRYYFNGQVTSTHKRDALKHGLHFWKYKTKGMNIDERA